MRQGFFVKITVRRLLFCIILLLLIGFTAFSFVMRTTEFMVVNERILEISTHFRTIGFLRPSDGQRGCVEAGADVLSNSDFVGFEDRRRGATAFLVDSQNAFISGSWIFPDWIPHALFYGTLNSITSDGNRATMRVRVDEVVAGHYEHILSGRTVTIHHYYINGEGALNDIEVGERYFIRAAYRQVTTGGQVRNVLPSGVITDTLELSSFIMHDKEIWYIHAPTENNFIYYDIANIIQADDLNTRAMWLRTTADMTAMPTVHEQIGTISLSEGRLLNHKDHLEASPVVVINHHYANIRGIGIGDTITVSVPTEQRITRATQIAFADVSGGDADDLLFAFRATFQEYDVRTNSEAHELLVEDLELTVVGTFEVLRTDITNPVSANMFTNFAFIPDSLLPSDFFPTNDLQGGGSHVLDTWYSFTLADTRDESTFIHEYRDTLAALGFDLLIIPSESENFWVSAQPMLTSATFNAVIFWVASVLVLLLMTYLYLSQNKSSVAILRSLGMPKKNVIGQILFSITCLGLPAIIIGGIVGWHFALNMVEESMYAISEIMDIAISINISMLWLALQIFVLFLVMFVMTYAAIKILLKRPVLELLQGKTGKMRTGKS